MATLRSSVHLFYLKPMQLRRLHEVAARFDPLEKRSAFFERVAAILKFQCNSRPTDRDLELVITAALQALAGHGETWLYS